jgi:tetratricopeptide (TPR) repeat protein
VDRKVKIAISGFLLLFSSAVLGNDKLLIYNAYILNDMPAWKTVIDRLQKQEDRSSGFLLSLVNYQFGYIGWCIGEEKVQEAESYIAIARENLDLLQKNSADLSMVYAYQSALNGYEIGLSVFRAPFIGPKSIKYAERALEIDPTNYFAWLQLGNIQYFMPSIFGGSVKEALRYFLKAKALMDKNRDIHSQDWNYLHLLTLIAQAYSDLKDYPSARVYYETILKIEPRFQWSKDELYPKVLKHFRN